MEEYMGIKDIEAYHDTLAIENPHTEVQLLHYHRPNAIADADIGKLNKLGFNHICFAVDDLDAEVAKLTAAGVKLRNKVMDFHNRKLVFLQGPEDITVELAQWH
jgi:catechol 2,3-dioxygenase-like lactoylglutathione lyase family enzyme